MSKSNPNATITPEVDIDVIKHKALMVHLTRKKIPRNKMDKGLGEYVREKKKVDDASALRVNKSIFPKEDTDKYQTIQGEAAKYFYRVTTPWDDNGWRLLSIDIFSDFTKKMKGYTSDFKRVVYDFIDTIEDSIEKMKTPLGGAFSSDDYSKIFNRDGSVDREFLLGQFSLEVEFDTVTTGSDIRASLTEDDKKTLADEINKKATAKFAATQDHIRVSLLDAIEKIHERLSKEKNIFRDTLIGNLEELCDIVPLMNIAGDAALNQAAKDAKSRLTRFTPNEIREDTDKRKEIAKEAQAMANNLKGVI